MSTAYDFSGVTTGFRQAQQDFNAQETYKNNQRQMADQAKSRELSLQLQQKQFNEYDSNRVDAIKLMEMKYKENEIKLFELQAQQTKTVTMDLMDRFSRTVLAKKPNYSLVKEIFKQPLNKEIFGDIVEVRALTDSDTEELGKFSAMGVSPEVAKSPANMLVIRSDGSRDVIDTESLYAASGYAKYAEDTKFTNELANMKVSKSATVAMKESAELSRLQDIIDSPTASTEEKARAKRDYENLVATAIPASYIKDQDTTKAITKSLNYTYDNIISGTNFNQEEAKLIENRLSTKETKEVLSEISNIAESQKLLISAVKQAESMDEGQFGIDIENLRSTFGKYIDSNGKVRQEVVNDKVKFDTTLGMAVASYIKSMSGLTVSDNERKFLVQIIRGGDLVSKEALLTALKTFTNNVTSNAKSKLQGVAENAPYSANKLIEALKLKPKVKVSGGSAASSAASSAENFKKFLGK